MFLIPCRGCCFARCTRPADWTTRSCLMNNCTKDTRRWMWITATALGKSWRPVTTAEKLDRYCRIWAFRWEWTAILTIDLSSKLTNTSGCLTRIRFSLICSKSTRFRQRKSRTVVGRQGRRSMRHLLRNSKAFSLLLSILFQPNQAIPFPLERLSIFPKSWRWKPCKETQKEDCLSYSNYLEGCCWVKYLWMCRIGQRFLHYGWS